jgi:hypothetical protein
VRQPSIPLDGEPSTGEPDAGEPPVRFGGKGGAETRLSYPYRLMPVKAVLASQSNSFSTNHRGRGRDVRGIGISCELTLPLAVR